MKKFDGGAVVPGGFYLSLKRWEIVVVQGNEGTLEGGTESRYVKLNVVTMLVAAVALAFSFAFYLPGVGVVLFVRALVKGVGRMVGRLFGKTSSAQVE